MREMMEKPLYPLAIKLLPLGREGFPKFREGPLKDLYLLKDF